MSSASTYRPPLTTRQLLVSVQNAEEARLAFQSGVPWVDLKNPASGALGQPSTTTFHDFINVAVEYPSSQISCALGEFRSVDWECVDRWLPHFSVGKIGFADQNKLDDCVIDKLAAYEGKIVPALYADWQLAGSAPPEQVLHLVRALRSPYLLIDTFTKDGRGLFHWIDLDNLRALNTKVQSCESELVVAGSLKAADWPALEQLGPITIGVRGAVCQSNNDRTSSLNAQAIQSWLQWSLSDDFNG